MPENMNPAPIPGPMPTPFQPVVKRVRMNTPAGSVRLTMVEMHSSMGVMVYFFNDEMSETFEAAMREARGGLQIVSG